MTKETGSIIFEDREDAGKQLGNFLKERYRHLDPLVLGVPRGGAVVAHHVAKSLGTEAEVIISKKLPLPGNAEIGFGAIAEDLSVYIATRYPLNLKPETICEIIDRQTDEVNRRIHDYRGGRSLPDMKDRTVIIVDDGIATGVTLIPLLRLCRKKGASRIVVAAPVGGRNYDPNLNEADNLEILVFPEWFYAVGQVYAFFKDLSDKDMERILSQ
ncbi:phosphoribosyltransferase [Dyadobacter pollutisoli]|uniref:Phosphoribosyltransferase family protein n=1 Tax=Dyadobacter pollutisoli TaxID=2910158 RepID=A0A9E8N8R8_9BACT|nr:phosphoribosyltransferase family protein [Dyadobacter pollutisoli]WAC10596.1 phosphoribosyltransferase family protein [Dyadobacter pollutisoli]